MSPARRLGEVTGGWTRGTATHGFVAQHATDATYSAIAPVTKTKYTLGGLPSGSVVYLRIAAIDPTAPSGIGPGSAWASGTAR